MDEAKVWGHVTSQRLALLHQLRDLSDDEWGRPSLCDGWTVKDVAAHVTASPQVRARDFPAMMARGGLSYNRMVLRDGQRRGRAPVAQLLADHERLAGVHRAPPLLSPLEPLLDILVHTQDILRPLGRTHTAPTEAVVLATDRARRMAVFLGSRKLVRGVRMVATDADWDRGAGPTVEGPMQELLMLCAGRTAHARDLRGDGLELVG